MTNTIQLLAILTAFAAVFNILRILRGTLAPKRDTYHIPLPKRDYTK